eukprot:TRINITY_DN16112_c0_g1_i1.p1 TRINITY_DN16112_c0_g1~~TRINITY_DN16112_c0_g1_i1.p1  ORF type:complete len:1211 (+),score=546.16 TRINITY_DN16112_c0_g1_i1:46-3678(+)
MVRKRPDARSSASSKETADAAAVKRYIHVLHLREDSKFALSEGIREIREEAIARVKLPNPTPQEVEAASKEDLAKALDVAAGRAKRLTELRGRNAMKLLNKEQARKKEQQKKKRARLGDDAEEVSAMERFRLIIRDCESFTGMKMLKDEAASPRLPAGTPNRTASQDPASGIEELHLDVADDEDDEQEDVVAASPAAAGTPRKTPSKGAKGGVGGAPLGYDTDPLSAPKIVHGKNPEYLSGVLRPYQVDGVNWMLSLHHRCLSGILADEMGLGKTFQTIALLAFLKYSMNVPGPHLVICPRSVLGNWNREFARFAPDMSILMFHALKDERPSLRKELLKNEADVVLTTWEQLTLELAAFKKIQFRYLILDEGHKIKNEQSIVAQNVRSVKCTNRLLLTGTPLQNNLQELWALLNFLLPGLFDDMDTFDGWFDCVAGSSEEQVMDKMHHLLTPFMLRRIKTEADADIPPKKEVYIGCRMSKMQKVWYQGILAKDLDSLSGAKVAAASLQNIMMHLRKVCDHPFLFDGAEEGPPFITDEKIIKASGKMIILDKLLHKLFAEPPEKRQKVLIFSQMTRMLDILSDYLTWRGWRFCRLDGSTSGEDRDMQMNDFNSPDTDKQLFLLSTRAGGLGINLQTASVVILYDSDWNPQADLQAMDRAHRIGQKNPVTVFRFITDGTVEERIYQRAMKKLYLDAIVVQQGNLQKKRSANVSKDELKGMIKWGAAAVFKEDGDEKDIEDVDIDAIIEMGAKKIKDAQAALEQNQQQSLKSFELGVDEANMYEFEGVDYTTKPTSSVYIEVSTTFDPEKLDTLLRTAGDVVRYIASPTLTQAMVQYKRLDDAIKAKSMFDGKVFSDVCESSFTLRYGGQRSVLTDEMKGQVTRRLAEEEAARRNASAAKRAALEKDEEERDQAREEQKAILAAASNLPKFKRYPPYQFFDNDKLEDLHDKEARAKLLAAKRKPRSAAAREAQAQQAEGQAPEPEPGLSAEDAAKRAELLAAGFPNWRRDDFKKFIKCLVDTGSECMAQVAREMPGFSVEELERYNEAFWREGPTTLEDFEAHRQKIEKRGDERRAMVWKLEQAPNKPPNPFSPTAPLPKEGMLSAVAYERYALAYAHDEGYNFEAVANRLAATPELFFNMRAVSRKPRDLDMLSRRNQAKALTEREKVDPEGAHRVGGEAAADEADDAEGASKKRSAEGKDENTRTRKRGRK